MNILQVVPHYIPAVRFGGPLQVAHGLGTELVRMGHKVQVCTTSMADRHEDLVGPRRQELQGVVVEYSPVWLARYWAFSPAIVPSIIRGLKWSDVALIHAHYQFPSTAAATLARWSQRPYVMFAHSTLRRASIGAKSSLKKRLYLALLEGRNLKNAVRVVFNAPEEMIDSLYSDNGVVIPNAVNADDFDVAIDNAVVRRRYNLGADELVFVFLGRLDVLQKGLDLVVVAFRLLRDEGVQARLVLAGPDEGSGKKQLQELCSRLGLERDVVFTGPLHGLEKIELLRSSDAFVLGSRYEGGSVALLEAMAAGLPVIITESVGLAAQIGDSGAGAVAAPTERSLLSAMQEMVSPSRRAEYGLRGRTLVRASFSWQVIAAELMNEVQAALGE